MLILVAFWHIHKNQTMVAVHKVGALHLPSLYNYKPREAEFAHEESKCNPNSRQDQTEGQYFPSILII